METPAEIRERWRHLRDLLIEQLGRFESGALRADNGMTIQTLGSEFRILG